MLAQRLLCVLVVCSFLLALLSLALACSRLHSLALCLLLRSAAPDPKKRDLNDNDDEADDKANKINQRRLQAIRIGNSLTPLFFRVACSCGL